MKQNQGYDQDLRVQAYRDNNDLSSSHLLNKPEKFSFYALIFLALHLRIHMVGYYLLITCIHYRCKLY